MTNKKEKMVRLNVKTNLLESEGAENLPQMVAYAFSAGGRLLAQAPVDEKGAASLSFAAADEAQSVRVLVGPKLEGKEINLADLQRRGAEDRFVRIDPDNLRASVDFALLPDIWRCWLLGLCFVRGKLLKRVVSGGVSIDLPVCNATVEVYEVDPIWIIIPRLPALDIERIRQYIINPPPPPPPPLDQPIGPFPPIGPEGTFVRMASAAEAQPMEAMSAPMSMTTTAMKAAAPRAADMTNLEFMARTTDTAQFRQTLIANASLIRPIFCILFPVPVTMSLVATATTDECGRFQTFFFRGCNNPDTPDLYFRAKQRIFPNPFPPFTIYAPTPIACYTYWNYACGTEVTLYTTNPLAIACAPCPPVIAPNNWVLFMAIGNFPLSRIRGTGDSLQATTNAINIGLTDGGAPWGGLLRPRIEFDNSLRAMLGVKYYQVSWRKGAIGPFQPLTGEVHRHYTHMVGADLVLEVYSLGPQVVNGVPNLFEIPPALPPIGQWSIPDAVEDTTSAKFPTGTLAPATPIDQSGKYQLRLDLFDVNGAPVNIAAKGIKYVVPTSTDLSGTINTEDANTLGLVSGNSFIMTLHIDNNVCSASIAAPTLNMTAADPNCGVLTYNPNAPGSVVMNYTASHPNGFATYSFSVVRGVNPVVGASGPVGAGNFSIVEPVNTLLGGCTVAGFSENLYVAAMATNGWSRLSNYDASAVRAFVLSP